MPLGMPVTTAEEAVREAGGSTHAERTVAMGSAPNLHVVPSSAAARPSRAGRCVWRMASRAGGGCVCQFQPPMLIEG